MCQDKDKPITTTPTPEPGMINKHQHYVALSSLTLIEVEHNLTNIIDQL